eukprot:CAMPEP_0117529826 /NCGR_PEP_ID=MMETSP0784-20121206/38031_1 /TAXON_ID=39447 /ORGANISM="" /LENGTH=190 /DNA_ID=CAMNT_0005326157 /DNA_START=89 /DNA_END=663 /DNA_ORIENTATION=-
MNSKLQLELGGAHRPLSFQAGRRRIFSTRLQQLKKQILWPRSRRVEPAQKQPSALTAATEAVSESQAQEHVLAGDASEPELVECRESRVNYDSAWLAVEAGGALSPEGGDSLQVPSSAWQPDDVHHACLGPVLIAASQTFAHPLRQDWQPRDPKPADNALIEAGAWHEGHLERSVSVVPYAPAKAQRVHR